MRCTLAALPANTAILSTGYRGSKPAQSAPLISRDDMFATLGSPAVVNWAAARAT
jgi:hypothetical protein